MMHYYSTCTKIILLLLPLAVVAAPSATTRSSLSVSCLSHRHPPLRHLPPTINENPWLLQLRGGGAKNIEELVWDMGGSSTTSKDDNQHNQQKKKTKQPTDHDTKKNQSSRLAAIKQVFAKEAERVEELQDEWIHQQPPQPLQETNEEEQQPSSTEAIVTSTTTNHYLVAVLKKTCAALAMGLLTLYLLEVLFLDPDTRVVANAQPWFLQTMTYAALVQGLFATEAPQACLAVYGARDTPYHRHVAMPMIGSSVLSVGVMAWNLVHHHPSGDPSANHNDVYPAIGWSFVVWAVHHAKVLLHDIPAVAQERTIVGLVVSLLAIPACLAQGGHHYVVGTALWMALHAMVAVVQPQRAAALWYGHHNKDTLFVTTDQDVIVWTRGYGFELLAYCVLILSLMWGVDPIPAMAYMSIPVILHTGYALVGSAVPLGVPGTVLVFAWMLFHAANLVVLGFGDLPV